MSAMINKRRSHSATDQNEADAVYQCANQEVLNALLGLSSRQVELLDSTSSPDRTHDMSTGLPNFQSKCTHKTAWFMGHYHTIVC